MPEERRANEVAVHAGFLEAFQGDFRLDLRGFEVGQKHRAELRFFSVRGLAEEVGDYRTEEKPPEIESLIQFFQFNWFDAVI